MRRDTVVSARKRARIEALGVASGMPPSDTHGRWSRRAHYAALGKLALENMRHTLDWCVNTLRLTREPDRRDDGRTPHEQ